MNLERIPTNCDAHLVTSNFQTRPSIKMYNIKATHTRMFNNVQNKKFGFKITFVVNMFTRIEEGSNCCVPSYTTPA